MDPAKRSSTSRSGHEKSVRAKRHRLALSLQYRVAAPGERVPALVSREWRKGKLCNISATGALLQVAAHALQPGVFLELQLSLPAELVGSAEVPLVCLARIVRVEQVADDAVQVGVALQRGALLPKSGEGPLPYVDPGVPEVQHKINNLLTSIVGTSELMLLNETLPAAEKSRVARIREFALRAAAELQALKNPAA
ncbi:MAG: PilZ domain-containing protein [Acidobacteria bacterium]|nr:PilZ domain-containing protein [Acidobacteriota bacterium]